MGQIRFPIPAKLFIGMLSPDRTLLSECGRLLQLEYGQIDIESDVMPWSQSDYYHDEMGEGILRKFIFFKDLIDPALLPSIKLFTNSLEERFAIASQTGLGRRINIDPGYVTEAKVVLATTKDFSHRVYIGENIYAEVTLTYSNSARGFMSLNHTYFDFRTDQYKELFNKARQLLRADLKKQG